MSLATIVTGLGHGAAAWGYGGYGGSEDTEFPAKLTLPAITGRIHIGDTVVLAGVLVKNYAGTLVDPSTLTVIVQPDEGARFTLAYGTSPVLGSGDAVIRTATGTFTVQIEITSTRGTGLYEFSIVTTGARAAEDGSFRVYPRIM